MFFEYSVQIQIPTKWKTKYRFIYSAMQTIVYQIQIQFILPSIFYQYILSNGQFAVYSQRNQNQES